MLADRSFRDLTVEEVMAEAGLPRTTFYRYFPDLESILLLGVARVTDELAGGTEIWLAAEADPIAALRPAAEALVGAYRRHGRLLLALSEAAATAPKVEAAWQEAIGRFVDRAARRIRVLRRSGLTDVAHPRELATALVWMTERFLLETYGRGAGMRPSTAVETLVLVWRRTLFYGAEERD